MSSLQLPGLIPSAEACRTHAELGLTLVIEKSAKEKSQVLSISVIPPPLFEACEFRVFFLFFAAALPLVLKAAIFLSCLC
jgi:hypothetical protein